MGEGDASEWAHSDVRPACTLGRRGEGHRGGGALTVRSHIASAVHHSIKRGWICREEIGSALMEIDACGLDHQTTGLDPPPGLAHPTWASPPTRASPPRNWG